LQGISTDLVRPSEHTDKVLIRQLGIFIGPAIGESGTDYPFAALYKHSADHECIPGGFLVDPAEQYSAFRNVAFFKDYPYALPGFMSGAFCLSTAIASFLFLHEVSLSKIW
jgi:hypothetical protein